MNLFFFLIYRFVGGIPFTIANLLPVLFNVKLKNYFFGSFLGIMPQGFIVTSLGSGISEIIIKIMIQYQTCWNYCHLQKSIYLL